MIKNTDKIFIFEDVDAERLILGTATISDKWLSKVLRDCTIDDFENPICKKVFEAVQILHGKGQATDCTTVCQYLLDRNQSPENMTELRAIFYSDYPYKDADYSNAIKRLKEKTKGRKLYREFETGLNLLKNGETADDVLKRMSRLVADLTTVTGYSRERLNPHQQAESMIETFFQYQDPAWRKENIIFTGIEDLDDRIQGFEKGDLIVISGETGTGKSAYAIDLSYNIGVLQKVPILYLNSEMSKQQVSLRLDARAANISHAAARQGKATEADGQAVVAAAEKVSEGKLFVAKCPDLNFENIKEELDLAVANGARFVIVDYFGRSDYVENNRGAAEWQILISAAQKLKGYAQQTGLVIVLMAQSTAGELQKSRQVANECEFWLDIQKVPEDKLQEFMPYNYFIDIKKARNVAKGDGQIFMFFDADRMTFVYDTVEAGNRQRDIANASKE